MDIKKNVGKVQQNIQACQHDSEKVRIVAATKYVNVEQMKKLYDCGIMIMGENRVDALLDKKAQLHLPIEWHFIGTLQSRKVKEMINEIDVLHSLDRFSLAKEIEKYRKTPLKCFIQVNISGESTKQGLAKDDVSTFMEQLREFSNIEVIGLMTMAPHTEDEAFIRHCFKELKKLQLDLVKQYQSCQELSMGMSNDYLIAIEEGATYVRLGSILFEDEEQYEAFTK